MAFKGFMPGTSFWASEPESARAERVVLEAVTITSPAAAPVFDTVDGAAWSGAVATGGGSELAAAV